jgi:molecular chaperone IbpA
MTYTKFPSLWNTESFEKHFIGLDQLHKSLMETATMVNKDVYTKYPPYNIKKVEDNKYVIEMAVAGFVRQDIEITLEENKLLIKGSISSDEENNYLFKGIADRAFTRVFTLADNVEIQNAELINGMLKVWLEHIIPESKKPKKVEIVENTKQTKSK